MIDEECLYKTLGERIRSRRERTQGSRGHMTQAELAALVGMERTSITNIEKGSQKVPLHMLYRICDALGAAIGSLLPIAADLQPRTAASSLDVQGIAEQQAAAGRPLLGQAISALFTDDAEEIDAAHS